MLKNSLFIKIITLAVLALVLLIPLGMIASKISERQQLQQQVQQDIARHASGSQRLSGPWLVLQYRVRLHETIKDQAGKPQYKTRLSAIKEVVLNARQLQINGHSDVETRQRGIYQAHLYNLQQTLQGGFQVPAAYGSAYNPQDMLPLAAYFVMQLSDARGIHNVPQLQLNEQSLTFEPGLQGNIKGNGIHAGLAALDPTTPHHFKFSFALDLQGMRKLAFVPGSKRTEVSLTSSWPHPSFGGSYLPKTHEISAQGFQANWLISDLARNHNQSQGASNEFSVEFIEPINIYSLSERAVKYGVLFVVLVFTAFFMFEILRELRIHPMQYLLVGLAMAMFFLLMISLSERISFVWAYISSAAACIVLIGVYLAGVLNSPRPAMLFSSGIALMYAVLYGVLHSEDNALLLGALLMFITLTAVMLLTRKMDWYQVGIKNIPSSTRQHTTAATLPE